MNSDGVLAGKSDPYVIVEVPGQEGMKFQTEVISNELNPVWNCTGEIGGFMDGDVLRFTVMDKDTFPNPDDFLGKAELTAQDFYPNGFHGALSLADSKTQASLTVMVVIAGTEGEGAQMMAPSGSAEGAMVAGSSSAAVYAADAGDGSTMMGNSAPVMYAAPTAMPAGVAMQGMTYAAPQTYSVPMSTSVMGSQPMTYAASQAPVQSPESIMAAGGKVIVHPPVTVTAEEFARINGTLVSEPLPVTVNQEAVVNDTEAIDKSVKIKKKKSKGCC